ncbi:hydantoinase/oxoprolinase family protein [Nocardioides sp. QY071]|uniref:hydantoinase/oxoprolinase family protein n=1 Tax=Nocardioides sp. QY071 TaxID=3044187 RepID=UPI00249C3D29|nr:hydantoinase/oxoprolinase family protein [Nocardioides sp. QY071]WGY01667.1 hydantoinase/oxoprolinase family protein [Nocardioides sp. QY071]
MEKSTSHTPWVVGIDVGGTFTDIVALDLIRGEVRDGKVLTTSEQEVGVLAAIRQIGIEPQEIAELVHGHTVGINAVLSRAGARTALLATDGHRDLLDIGRMNREFGPQFYDPTWVRPHQARPIVARQQRVGVPERMSADGNVVRDLDEAAVRAAAHVLKDDGVESVGICFVNAYSNPDHEQRAATIVREVLPEAYVQTSSLYSVTKEHERTTTVALDAYVGPAVTHYLHRLRGLLAEAGFDGLLWIMTMNGGVTTVEHAATAPVFQLVSGPVGGVAGSVRLAQAGGPENLLTMDVGGTSTDVASIVSATTPMTDLWTLEQGLTLTMPLVDVGSVGSGAGSIISVDSLGALRVGPASAGSVPGPACYGRGGADPTLTDACVALGILQPDLFAGGAMELDTNLARKALATVAESVGLDATKLASAAYAVACEDMAAKIRSVSVYRGMDLRDFALLPFGAAGPMLANQVAEILGLDTVIVPYSPGQFSALGLLGSDLRVTTATAPMTMLTAGGALGLEQAFTRMEQSIRDDLMAQGLNVGALQFERAFFGMYAGQTWDNRRPLADGPITAETVEAMVEEFHTFYQRTYGFSARELPVMCTSLEVTGVVARDTTVERRVTSKAGTSYVRTATVIPVGRGPMEAEVHQRELLTSGARIEGPALVVERFATTFIQPGWSGSLREDGCLVVSRINERGSR